MLMPSTGAMQRAWLLLMLLSAQCAVPADIRAVPPVAEGATNSTAAGGGARRAEPLVAPAVRAPGADDVAPVPKVPGGRRAPQPDHGRSLTAQPAAVAAAKEVFNPFGNHPPPQGHRRKLLTSDDTAATPTNPFILGRYLCPPAADCYCNLCPTRIVGVCLLQTTGSSGMFT
jgi:hypothetical protein